VARIVPFVAGEHVTATARRTLFKRLVAAPVVAVGRWTRDDLYERSR
jgi:hypothetical protein